MPIVSISGIEVEFPKEPYSCQVDYMRSAIRAITDSSNALLESPTGTGKTLSLLCSTLAWQKHMRASAARVTHKLEYNSGPTTSSTISGVKAVVTDKNSAKRKPLGAQYTIVYASRTHSQLAQVVEELKCTNYRPRMTVLGSRDQLCIHDKISKLKAGALNHACNTLNSQRGCSFKTNLDKYSSSSGGNAIAVMDIEEVKRVVGHADRVCPYFYTREVSANADLVLLPYNYLLDNSIRATLKLDWQNSIVIFDEAHNLERVAADAVSFTLTSTDLAGCIIELQGVLKSLQERKENGEDVNEESDNKATDKNDKSLSAILGGDAGGSPSKDPPTIQGSIRILRALFELEKKIDQVPLDQNGPGKTPSNVLPGAWLCNLLEDVGLAHTMAANNIEELRRCSNYILLEADSAGGGLSVPEPKLVALTGAFSRVFRGRTLSESVTAVADYKVFICEEENVKKNSYSDKGGHSTPYQLPAGVRVSGGHYNTSDNQKKRVLNFWAFSPGIAMEDLKNLGVRTVILTSGTLSPMESFKEDMKLPFPIQLENKHVIQNKQIWVGCITTGMTGKQLNSSFKVRETADYKDEMGGSILNITRTMAGQGGTGSIGAGLPPGPELDGGILVFFPSYGVMDSCVERWCETGLLERLRNVGGAVVIEPKASGAGAGAGVGAARNKSQGYKKSDRWSDSSTGATVGSKGFGIVSTNVNSKAVQNGVVDEEDEGAGGGAGLGGVIKEFEATLASRGRCVLLAVCRGKASEGIDFRNNKGRVVIITGIPFAPPMDPWVVLKKLYLDEKCLKQLPPKASGPSSSSGSGTLNSVMSLEQAKRVYGNTGGFGAMPPPVNPYTANSYKDYDAVNGHNQPMPIQTPTVYPPPNPMTQSVSNGYGTSSMYNTTSGAKKRFLDGQAWYNQTASRAVNQAIGRVIRHKKDWGAIFLLDDRFQIERQVSQLSSWVRPRLQKYSKFSPALVDFRRFLSSAMMDPDLKIPVPVVEVADSRPPGFVQAIAAIAAATAAASASALRGNDDNTVTRKISIKESDLNSSSTIDKENKDTGNKDGQGYGEGDGESSGVSFINPALLMTQATDPAYSQMTSSLSSSRNNVRLPYNSGSSKSFGLIKSSSSINCMIDITALDGSNSNGGYGNSSSSSSSSSNSNSSSSSSSSNSSSNSSSSNSNSSSSSSSNALNNAKSAPSGLSGFLAMMSAKATVTPSNARLNNSGTSGKPGISSQSSATHIGEAPIKKRSTPASQECSKSAEESLPISNATSAHESSRQSTDFQRSQSSLSLSKSTPHTRHSDSQIESASVKRKSLMTSFSQAPKDDNKGDKISDISRGKSQGNVTGSSQVEEAQGRNHSSSSSSSNSSNSSSSSSSSIVAPSKSRPVTMTTDAKSVLGYNYTETLSQVDQGSAEQASQPSKRAKMMLQAALTPALNTVVKKGVNGIFAKFGSHGFREQMAKNAEYDRATAKSKESLNVKKCVCLVCNSIAAEPCVAKCGHICCESCWSQWLGRKQTCPYCRAPTTMQQIKKITIVRN